MHIAFVHNRYFAYSSKRPYKGKAGGAPLSNIAIIREGEQRGYKIDIIFAHEKLNLCDGDYIDGEKPNYFLYKNYDITKADLVILSHTPKFDNSFIAIIRDKTKFVRWDHAYDFCTLGVANMCEEICFKTKCQRCHTSINRQLHEKAILSIFQSPFHKEIQEKVLESKFDNSFILPPPIDVDLFKCNPEITREDNSYLIIGSIMRHKGIDNILNFVDKNPTYKFTFIGGGKDDYISKVRLRKNCRVIDHTKNYLLPEIYNKHKYYIHLPLWFEPSSRSTMEAYLMGCKLIMNDKVGTISFDFMKNKLPIDQIREIINNAPKMFWENVEKNIK